MLRCCGSRTRGSRSPPSNCSRPTRPNASLASSSTWSSPANRCTRFCPRPRRRRRPPFRRLGDRGGAPEGAPQRGAMVVPATDADVRDLTQLLGRPPRAAFDVVVRGAHREPVVIRNAPLLHDRTPMPTRYWLVDPELSKRVSRLESTGGVRAADAGVDPEALRATHDRYAG